MKTKSIKKVMIVGSVLLIGVVICVSVWFFLSEYKVMDTPEQNQQSVPKISKDANNETAKVARPSPDRESLGTRREIVARQSRSLLMSHFSKAQLATPHVQKLLEAMDSPEYAELPSDFSTHEWRDFLESKGVPVTRGNPGIFTEHPPFMSLEDYEPIVRYRVAKSFLAAEPADMADPEAAILLRAKILIELDDANGSGFRWFLERFGDDWREVARVHEGMENNPAVIWMNDIQQNAASIVKAAEQARSDALKASAPSWDMSSVMESPPVFPNEMEENRLGMEAPSTDTDEQYDAEKRTAATPTVDQEKEVTNALPTLPVAPTGEELETALREQFSPEHFERALSTLERYGPEEGLRRLKESDPEVAKQVEKARHHNRQENAQ